MFHFTSFNSLREENEKLKEENKKLINDNKQLKEENKTLSDKVIDLDKQLEDVSVKYMYENNIYNNAKKIAKAYKDRMDFSVDFLEFLDGTGEDHIAPIMFGSFVRKLMELPFGLSDILNTNFNKNFTNDSYANPITGQIDFSFEFDKKNVKSKESHKKTNAIIDLLRTNLSYSIVSQNIIPRPKFGDFELDSIENVLDSIEHVLYGKNLIIENPLDNDKFEHYKLIFNSPTVKNFTINLYSCKPGDGEGDMTDFTVNDIKLSSDGYESVGTNMFSILRHIRNKTTSTLINFSHIQQHVFSSNYILTRNDKLEHLSPLCYFISFRYPKIMAGGYDVIAERNGGSLIKFEIEKIEDCLYWIKCSISFSHSCL